MSFDFISLFVAAVLAGTPLLLGTLGEILTEKSGHLNLGVEGMMFRARSRASPLRGHTNRWQRARGLRLPASSPC